MRNWCRMRRGAEFELGPFSRSRRMFSAGWSEVDDASGRSRNSERDIRWHDEDRRGVVSQYQQEHDVRRERDEERQVPARAASWRLLRKHAIPSPDSSLARLFRLD